MLLSVGRDGGPQVMCDAEESTQMEWLDTQAMLWLGGRCWWFPGKRISAESQFEWKNGRAYLLEPDGCAVKGILFVGEVAPE
jgi:hypothetical protein